MNESKKSCDESELPNFDSYIEKKKGNRDLFRGKPQSRKRPRETEPVKQAESKSDDPRIAICKALMTAHMLREFERQEDDAQGDDGFDRSWRNAHNSKNS